MRSRNSMMDSDDRPVLPPAGDFFDGTPDPEPEEAPDDEREPPVGEPNTDRQLPVKDPPAHPQKPERAARHGAPRPACMKWTA